MKALNDVRKTLDYSVNFGFQFHGYPGKMVSWEKVQGIDMLTECTIVHSV